MTALVLAGGKSKRFGANKPLVKIGDCTLIERVVDTLRQIFDEVAIVANKKNCRLLRPLFESDIKIFEDIIADRGPLGGLYTGFTRTTAQHLFVAGCDMPFLNKALIMYMQSELGNYDAVVPKTTENTFEPLYAFYSINCLATIECHLRKEELRIASIFNSLNVRYILPEEIKKFDPELRSFTNINYKGDIDKLCPSILTA